MALAEDEHEVQTLGSGRPDPSLGDGVGARRSEWGPDLPDAEIVQPPIEHLPVAAVAVMDEKARWLAIPAAAFDDLLRHPFRWGWLVTWTCRRAGTRSIQYLSQTSGFVHAIRTMREFGQHSNVCYKTAIT